MTDIVERLRNARAWVYGGMCCGMSDDTQTCAAPACPFGDACKWCAEAADEIERLRLLVSSFGINPMPLTDDDIRRTHELFGKGGLLDRSAKEDGEG